MRRSGCDRNRTREVIVKRREAAENYFFAQCIPQMEFAPSPVSSSEPASVTGSGPSPIRRPEAE